jgi:hypothetical protein
MPILTSYKPQVYKINTKNIRVNNRHNIKLKSQPPKITVTRVIMRATKAVKPPVISFLAILLSSSRQYPMKNRRKIPVMLGIFRAVITGENKKNGIITIIEEPTLVHTHR